MKKIKVIYKRLKKVWGYANMDDGTIEIDNRAKGKKHLEIVLHEMTHILWPDETEEEVERKSIIMTNTLWHEKYRRIDDANHTPLQDGTT
jgi:hypothetical protein